MSDDAVTFTLPGVVVHQAPPVTITQHNVKAVCGVEPNTFLRELLPLYRVDGGKVGERGKLRLVEREPFVRWLLAGERAQKETDEKSDAVVRLAERAGLVAVAGGRGR
jgi:hypothetical protein